MTANLQLLLDCAYHPDQVTHDPMALARYADVHNQHLVAVAIHLSCVAITDGQDAITLPSAIADRIMILQAQRLTDLVDLATQGLITRPYHPDYHTIEPFNVTSAGVAALDKWEKNTCPDIDGLAPPPA